MKRFDVVTIFPAMFEALTGHGITRRAIMSLAERADAGVESFRNGMDRFAHWSTHSLAARSRTRFA